MSMAERKTMTRAVKNPVKRKLTRAEKKEIAAVIQAAKGDGKPRTAQQTIPYLQMYPDGICRVTEKKYSKSLVFEDINYQLAQADDKTAIFENWCDFLNYFDASVSVQLSFINQGARKEKAQAAIEIPAQDDAFNSIRREYADMLKNQLEKGNNGLEKCKYITFSIEADNLAAAKARLSRIETDVLNNFKVLGVTARPMNGQERLNVLHGIFHPEGEPFRFSWDWLVPSGLTTKDFIAPSSFRFGDGRTFRMGRKLGAVSFLEILAPELNDRMLSDILDLENGIIVNLHIRSIDQSEAIKTIKRKITDLDKMKIEEQKKAVRSGYDMDIIPSDLATFGSEAKNLLQDLQSRNERMFLLTFLVVNMADTKRKLDNDIFATAGFAQKNNCALTRLVLVVAGIVLQIQHPTIAGVNLEVVGSKFHAVGAEPILEMLPALGVFVDIELCCSLFPCLEKIAENVQTFGQCQFGCHRGKLRQVCYKVGPHAGKVAACLVCIALYHAHGQVALPHNAVAGTGDLCGQHLVEFVAVFVQTIILVGQQDAALELGLIDAAVVNRDFGRCAGV